MVKKKVDWEEIYKMEITRKALQWKAQRDVDTVDGINRRLRYGGFIEMMRDADRFYDSVIWKAAGKIMSRRGDIRLVIVAGPSSSGKTTTTIKLCENLRTMGENLNILPLDNYFWNLKDQPKDEFDDYDFESPDALDKETIRDNITELLDKGETVTPIYNFKKGEREKEGKKVALGEGQLLVVEGLHGFHGDMTDGIPQDEIFRLYIETICQLKNTEGELVPWTDIRLLRRMVRDSWHRNYDPIQTIGHWHYVRRSEKEYIVPFIKEVEFIVNGYLPYEIPVHKKHMLEHLRNAVKFYEGVEKKEDAHTRSLRCMKLLESVTALEDESSIAPDSLLREFIGGSVYHY
ncbi:MAG: hypothetical protein P9M00_07625 [Candidatus Tritonobacter lacicola]|nr:hypothetical protein [Candidatus Tritonobacter lacicola]